MRNKSLQPLKNTFSEDLATICEQVLKNDKQLQNFFIKNKMRLPPILQTRHHYLFGKQEITNTIKKNQGEESFSRIGIKLTKQRVQKSPKIYQVVFQKGKRRQNKHQSLHSHHSRELVDESRLKNAGKKISKNAIQKQEQILKKQISIDELFQSLKKIPFKKISKQNDQSKIISQSIQIKKNNQMSKQSLNVNRLITTNPQNQLFMTIRANQCDHQNQQIFRPRRLLNNNRNLQKQKKSKENSILEPWNNGLDFQYELYPNPK